MQATDPTELKQVKGGLVNIREDSQRERTFP